MEKAAATAEAVMAVAVMAEGKEVAMGVVARAVGEVEPVVPVARLGAREVVMVAAVTVAAMAAVARVVVVMAVELVVEMVAARAVAVREAVWAAD